MNPLGMLRAGAGFLTAGQDVRAEVTTVVLPVLAALAGWLAVMYGIQHALIELPFLTGVAGCGICFSAVVHCFCMFLL